MNFSKKLSNVFIYASIFIFLLVLILYLFTNSIALFIILLGLIIYISKKFNFKHFGIMLFIFSFLIRLLMIIVADFPQIADFEVLLDASKMFALKDYSFNTWWHFKTWGYQTGFVIYQGFLLRLFNSIFLLKVLNAIYSSTLVLLIYKIGSKISDEKSARIVSLLYMIYPYHVFLNIVLANHHLATLLSYLGILFLIKNDKKIKDYIIAAILISFGNIIRPEGIIIVFSLILYEFFLLNKTRIKKTLISLFVFIFVYLMIGYTASFLVIKTNVNPSGLKNNEPMWKFILGFNYDTCGYYEDSDTQYLVSKETKINIIKERALSNLPRTGKLMVCKINHFWLKSDLDKEANQYNDKEFNIGNINFKLGNVLTRVVSVNNYLYLSVFIMFLIGIFVNRKKITNEILFLLILCVTTFFVFLLIEIQPRYAYFIQISIFILASLGFNWIFNKIEDYKK